ncbi:MAG: DUF1203 domain-containing protein [Alphaproteobacteria bacterium]|nr:DUF1203 domain-containing protein [Alphaproteobacteria bacterium]
MAIIFSSLDKSAVQALRAGGADSNGQPPEPHTSGGGLPCRNCLRDIEAGQASLVFGHRPFERLQPYAECGPIFICADACEPFGRSSALPLVMTVRPRFIIRGYTSDERIRYGTGDVVETADVPEACEAIFADPEVSFIHVRSVQNNCYFCRIDRG